MARIKLEDIESEMEPLEIEYKGKVYPLAKFTANFKKKLDPIEKKAVAGDLSAQAETVHLWTGIPLIECMDLSQQLMNKLAEITVTHIVERKKKEQKGKKKSG